MASNTVFHFVVIDGPCTCYRCGPNLPSVTEGILELLNKVLCPRDPVDLDLRMFALCGEEFDHRSSIIFRSRVFEAQLQDLRCSAFNCTGYIQISTLTTATDGVVIIYCP